MPTVRMLTLLTAALLAAPAAAADWPRWRGPAGDGIVADPDIPQRWSATENVAWKVPVPGVGHSSPIVSAGRVFLTSYLPDANARVVLALDRADGKLLWQAPVLTAAAERMHKNSSPANATPVADGKCVWAAFTDGNRIVIDCRDFDGKPVWQRAFDGFVSPHGFCGTPVLVDDLLIVNGDSDGDAFLAGLDKATGGTKWKVDRPNRTRSFSVPLVIDAAGRRQMVLAGSKSIASFDPLTGRQFWVADSPTDKFVATAAYADGVVCATGTSPVSTLVGIRPDGTGNVTDTHVLWKDAKAAAYVPSPLAVGKHLFVVTDAGMATMLEAKTGRKLWTERLGRHHDASPLLVNGLIYCLADGGEAFVIRPGDELEVVAANAIGEECHATPAASDGQLFIRTAAHLWCIGRPRAASPRAGR